MRGYSASRPGERDFTGRFQMANIVIKDLQENTELDRKAMRAITGGRSTQRLGVPSYHSSYFQKPESFNNMRLAPGMLMPNENRW